MTVAAVAACGHLYAGIHTIGADSHLIGGWLTIGAGIHHFQVGPVVALSRRGSGNFCAPPQVYAGSHEDFRVGDAER